MSNSLRPNELQHARLPCPSLSSRFFSNSCSLNQRCRTTISSSVVPSSSCPQFFPAAGFFPMSQFFVSGGQSIEASASVLPMNSQGWFPLGLRLVWSPRCPRGSQESSPAPQFKTICPLALSRLYSPSLTFIHDYWKNHSFDYTSLCWQSDVSAF